MLFSSSYSAINPYDIRINEWNMECKSCSFLFRYVPAGKISFWNNFEGGTTVLCCSVYLFLNSRTPAWR